MMSPVEDMPVAGRLIALMDHLGIARAHVAAQIPGDIADLILGHPDRVGGVVLCVPTRLDPVPFAGVAERLLMISSEHGMTGPVTERAAERLPGARRHIIAGYDAAGWSDTVADRTGDVVGAIREALGGSASRREQFRRIVSLVFS